MVIQLSKIYFHIDVNNAFLSWEAVIRLKEGQKLDLRTISSAVAGDPKKRTGIILAKSKYAKDMGVKTGEPIFEAKRKCPNLYLVPPRHKLYEIESKKLYELLTNYSDVIEKYSIDEYFIEYIPLLGGYKEVAEKIQKQIYKKLGFTVNIGISDVKYLAKVASDFEKPNKIHTLFKSEISNKLWNLPIENMFLLGNKTATKLKKLGIDTVYKLAHTNLDILKMHLKSQGEELYNFAWGKDLSDKHTKGETLKSVSHSKTSVNDLTDMEDIYNFILNVVNETSIRLRNEKMKTSTISVTLKTSNFKIYSSSKSIPYATDVTCELFKISKNIFNEMYNGEPLRLIGVSFSNLESSISTQLNIFEALDEKNHKVDTTVDNILKKYNNSKIITRASLLNNNN